MEMIENMVNLEEYILKTARKHGILICGDIMETNILNFSLNIIENYFNPSEDCVLRLKNGLEEFKKYKQEILEKVE